MSVKDQIRVDQNFQETPTGRLFFDSHSAKLTDLSCCVAASIRSASCTED